MKKQKVSASLGRLILASAGDGIYGVDSRGLTMFVNPAASRMLGRSAEEMLGQPIHDLIHHTHEDGAPYPKEQCPIYAAFKDGKIHSVDNEVFWNADGTSIPVEYTSTPILEEGRLRGAVVVFRNLTRLKRSEERLRNALIKVEELKNRLEAENTYLHEEINLQNDFGDFIGESRAMKNVLLAIETVAPTEASVLITGDTGTGKEMVARALHDLSPRHEGPFIKVNCAAVPRELFESEFFGHVRGAFTGAHRDRAGRFELAHGGTLFLDEVGEIPASMQSKLLRALQEGEIERVGETKTRKVNVRIVAATNRDLNKEMDEDSFRRDLYYRLNVFPIAIAPLRQRLEDIAPLALKFLARAAKRFHRPQARLTRANLRQLESYSWPGNVRELQNEIERSVITSRSGRLRFHLSTEPDFEDSSKSATSSHSTSGSESILTHVEMQDRIIENVRAALKECGGKIYGPEGAAQRLEMKPTTLASFVKKHHLK